jgi:hypothetical protein
MPTQSDYPDASTINYNQGTSMALDKGMQPRILLTACYFSSLAVGYSFFPLYRLCRLFGLLLLNNLRMRNTQLA